MKRAWFAMLFRECLYVSTLVWLSACSGPIEERQSNTNPGFFSSIYSDQPIRASLVFDLDSILYFRESEKEVDGTFILELSQLPSVPVEIRTRGITRKNICDFPPLRIQIKKAAIEENHWGDFRNYKLVTHCSDTLRNQELLYREYLVYKMYERLTPMSFRAQLLQIQYVLLNDTLDRFAILIENEDEMDNRLGLKALDPGSSGIKSIHVDHYKRFVLFQYMIGNTDWNMSTGHNTKYVLESNSNTPIIIPYDFDYCGLVNASYARPYETMPIDNVRDRYFMYRGKKEDDFSATVQEFLALKDAWLGMVDEVPYMSPASKQDMREYLEAFFGIIERPDWKDKVFPG